MQALNHHPTGVLLSLPAWVNMRGEGAAKYAEYNSLSQDERDRPPYFWSGQDELTAPPKIGERVFVRMNGFGYGTVAYYFVSSGWLGVGVKVEVIPQFYHDQNRGKQNRPGYGTVEVFGVEIQKQGADLKGGE